MSSKRAEVRRRELKDRSSGPPTTPQWLHDAWEGFNSTMDTLTYPRPDEGNMWNEEALRERGMSEEDIARWQQPQEILLGAVPDFSPKDVAAVAKLIRPTQRRLLPSAQKIISYHGTPESGFAPTSRNPLGEFNLNKIGSGEGSQIKWKGLYMSSDPEIADWYRRMLSQSGIGPSPNRGSLFEVGIRSSPEELIDLDKPLTDQSHQVQSVVRSIFDPLQPKSYEMVTESGLPSGRMGRDVGRPGSEYLEHTLFESPETALDAYRTQLLKEKGVPGAQYIGRTSGKRNYVVWDPDRLHILRKLITGVGAVGTGAAAGSQN